MIALLTRVLQVDLTVFSSIPGSGARTWYRDGTEAEGVGPATIWVAHEAEFHYYGVLRKGAHGLPVDHEEVARAKVRRELGLVSDSCPICTAAFTCAVCDHNHKKKDAAGSASSGDANSQVAGLPVLKDVPSQCRKRFRINAKRSWCGKDEAPKQAPSKAHAPDVASTRLVACSSAINACATRPAHVGFWWMSSYLIVFPVYSHCSHR